VKPTIYELLDSIEQQQPPPPELPPDADALEILRLVYRGELEVSPQQFKALVAAVPYERPKLSVSASMSHHGMGTMIDEARRAYVERRLINVTPQSAAVANAERERGE
jgi:hypothetical protein